MPLTWLCTANPSGPNNRSFTTLAECNRQALLQLWRDQVALFAHRRWPGDDKPAPSPRSSPKNNPRLLPKPRRATFPTDLPCFPCRRLRPSMSASISTITRSLQKQYRPSTGDCALPTRWCEILEEEGTAEIAQHHHATTVTSWCWIPAHQQALLEERNARLSTPLPEAVWHSPRAGKQSHFSTSPSHREKSAAGSGKQLQLLKLLDLYGPAALRRAINEALERNYTPLLHRSRFCCLEAAAIKLPPAGGQSQPSPRSQVHRSPASRSGDLR